MTTTNHDNKASNYNKVTDDNKTTDSNQATNNDQAAATIYRVMAVTDKESGEWKYNLQEQMIYMNSNQLFVGAKIYIHTSEGKCEVHAMKLVSENEEKKEWDVINGFRKDKENDNKEG